MTERKLVALWIVAMLVVGGAYLYSTRGLKNGTTPPTAPAAQNESEPTIALGSPMLPLNGTWLDGKAQETKNKVVLLDFWGTYCPPCVQSIPANTKLFETYGPKGLVFVGVSREQKVLVEDFKKARAIKYPLLASNEAAFEAYGIQFIPATLLFDKHGKLVWKGNQFEGPDGSMLPSFLKALNTALAAPDETADNAANLVALPPEFLELDKKVQARGPVDENAEIAKRGLKLGAARPALKGDWLTPDGAAPELKDKAVLLDFWTTACGTCVESIPANNGIHERYAPKGLLFIAATPETKDVIEHFKANAKKETQMKKEIRYALLTDCTALFDFCEITQLPTTLLFGKDGKLAWKGGALEMSGKLDEGFEKALNEALK